MKLIRRSECGQHDDVSVRPPTVANLEEEGQNPHPPCPHPIPIPIPIHDGPSSAPLVSRGRVSEKPHYSTVLYSKAGMLGRNSNSVCSRSHLTSYVQARETYVVYCATPSACCGFSRPGVSKCRARCSSGTALRFHLRVKTQLLEKWAASLPQVLSAQQGAE